MGMQAQILTAGLVTLLTAASTTLGQRADSRLRGSVKIDGSSTVYPITEAVAEEFRGVAPNVRVTVGISGTGGGFKRFVVGETDISDASRPIKAAEAAEAEKNRVEFVEIPVAYDGLSVVVNPKNDWIDHLTVDELKHIFLEGRAASTWADVRSSWPATPIKIYSPGTDSGTFDYFKEVVAGKTGSIRSDMSVSEDDNVLVRGVAGDLNAIGFFGVAYYEENKDQLRVVPVVNPESGEAVTPSTETILNGTYAPFSRPLFIYAAKNSLRRPEVRRFITFYLDNAPELSAEVGYVRLPSSIYDVARRRVARGQTGTSYLTEDGEKVEGPVTEVYR